MRISFDLDDTLICYGGATPCAPRLPLLFRLLVHDEPLRHGTRELIGRLRSDGHEVWIYTSSDRPPRAIRRWLRWHGIRVDGVVNGTRHDQAFGHGSLPTKRPHAFGIDLHVDDSQGVAREGERHRFNVCVIDPCAPNWTEQVTTAVRKLGEDATCHPTP